MKQPALVIIIRSFYSIFPVRLRLLAPRKIKAAIMEGAKEKGRREREEEEERKKKRRGKTGRKHRATQQ
jgi:hypothetical protein